MRRWHWFDDHTRFTDISTKSPALTIYGMWPHHVISYTGTWLGLSCDRSTAKMRRWRQFNLLTPRYFFSIFFKILMFLITLRRETTCRSSHWNIQIEVATWNESNFVWSSASRRIWFYLLFHLFLFSETICIKNPDISRTKYLYT